METFGRGTIGRKDFTYQSVSGANRELPMMFGANFNDDPITRTNLRRSHALNAKGEHQPPEDEMDPRAHDPHTRYDFTGRVEADVPNYHYETTARLANSTVMRAKPTAASLAGSYNGSTRSAAETAAKTTPVEETPIRFLGYIIENVAEGGTFGEKSRVRRVGVHFYASDETIDLRERQSPNSGIEGSVLLSRRKVPVDINERSKGNIRLEMLDIGETLNIYGKMVKIIDCAPASREHLVANCGRVSVPTALPWPDELDTFGSAMAKAQRSHARREMPTSDFDNKRAVEARSGTGVVSKHAPEDVRSAQQFFRQEINARLSFASLWDDRGNKSGDLRRVVIRYFLENDTVEIVEQRPENWGREGGPKLLMRQRVPKPGSRPPPAGSVTSSVQQNTYGLLLKSNYLTHDDLQIGKQIIINGRLYLLYDCDDFTRDWYANVCGKDLGPKVDVTEIVNKDLKLAPVHIPPPHTGFGSHEDSLQSWKSLTLKPLKVDLTHQQREAGKTMLFRASFAAPQGPHDDGREFLVTFHRATSEVEVQERQIRNSGIVGGKFLARARHLKTLPDGRKVPFTPDDFGVGDVVNISGRLFKLDEIDERSRRQLAGEEAPITSDRLKELIVTLRDQLNAKYVRINEAYRALAPEGVLSLKQIQHFFHQASGPISEEEAMGIIRYFAPDGSGIVPFSRFIKMMDPGNTELMDVAANSPRAVGDVKVFQKPNAYGSNGEVDPEATVFREQCVQAVDDHKCLQLKKLLLAKLAERRATTLECFRLLGGHTATSRLHEAEFRRTMIDVLHLQLSRLDTDIVVSMLYDTEEKRQMGIAYRDFAKFADQ